MPDFDINVVVKDGRAIGTIRQVDNELSKVEQRATRVRGIFGNLFAGFGAALVVRELIGLANASSVIDNRLKLVSDSSAEVEASFQKIADIARRTRSPLEENIALFQRAKQAQTELGASNADIFKFIEATGTALAIQGGSANTARGALTQLSQAIGATVVRAEEFNSILEGALPLAQAAARGIDGAEGSVAKLRQMVIKGKVSSEEFFNAIVEQQEYLEELFLRTNPTIAQSFTLLRNAAIETFRKLEQGTGISTIIANSLIFLADNLETVARILAAGAIAFGILKIVQALMFIPTAIKLITIAVATNPLGVLLVALSAAIGLIISFGDKIQLFATGTATALDYVIVLFGRLRDFIYKILGPVGDFLKKTFDNVNKISFSEFVFNVAKAVDFVRATFAGGWAFIEAATDNLAAALGNAFNAAFEFIVNKFRSVINFLLKGYNAALVAFGKAPVALFEGSFELDRFEGAGRSAGEAYTSAFNGVMEKGKAQAFAESTLVEAARNAKTREDNEKLADTAGAAAEETKKLGGAVEGAGKKAGKASKSFGELVGELEKQAEALTKLGIAGDIFNEQQRIAEELGRNLSEGEAALVEQLVRKIEVLETASSIYDDLNNRTREYAATQAALQQLLANGDISQNEADFAQSQSGLVQDLAGVDQSLGGTFEFESQLQQVRDYTNERTIILEQAREMDLINEQDYNARLNALTAASQREVLNLELDRWDMAISSAQGSIGILLDAAEKYAGKQSGIYKGLFIAQKAFAIAEATVNTFRAISNALAAPFPPPIPQTLAAAAAVAGGAQVAAIVASTVAGLADGGRVRGPGGPRDDKAGLYALSNGEFVVNAASTAANLPLLEAINRGNKIGAMQSGGLIASTTGLNNAGSREVTAASRSTPAAANVNNDVQVPVNVINVSSQEEALAAVGGSAGGEVILNQVSKNARQFRNVLGLDN